MKNEKKIIIGSVTISIIVLCIVLAILYFTTDIFKTNQQLFYKYIGQAKIIDSNFVKQFTTVNNIFNEKSSSSNMQIKVLNSKENTETQVTDIQELFTVNSNGLKNVLLNQSYRDFAFSKDNQTFLNVRYLKDNNTYGIIADNILAKYLSVDNANLKELFSKLGATDINSIPDSISAEYKEIIEIDDETYEKLKDIYFTLVSENINKDNFYKIKNEDETKTIGLSLSEQELINIINILLNNAKNDEILLNVINTKLRSLNYNDISIEKIQADIQEYIEQLNKITYSNEKDYLKISFILKNKQVIGLKIEQNYNEDKDINQNENVTHKRTLELDLSKACNINLVLKRDETEIFNIAMDWSYDNEKINISFETKMFENQEKDIIKFIYQISDLQTNNIKQNCNINIISNTEQYQINIENNVTLKEDVQITKLTTENSVKINDMSSEEINELINALINRINELYQIDLFYN